MDKIEILIHPDGRVEVDVKGSAGSECEALTRDLETALGRVTQRRRKAEFYQRAHPRAGQQSQQHHG